VALFSETHLKPHERFFITNYRFYPMDLYPGREDQKVKVRDFAVLQSDGALLYC
jgi:hypothetical protein